MDTVGVVSASAANVSAQVSSIPMLNCTNFKAWKDTVEIVLSLYKFGHSSSARETHYY